MKRILVIEDDPDYRLFLKKVLTSANFEVIEANDGDVGCDLYRQDPCDLIITDIFMPKKEGLGIIMELKKDYPDVKIIAISGGGGMSDQSFTDVMKMAKLLGADEIMYKPIKVQNLLLKVKEMFA